MALKADTTQDQALEELIRAQQDPSSRYFHQWLTPETFGEHFGVSPNDMAQIVNWLESQGMKIDELPSSRRAIVFSGSASQVEAAFHTRLLKYSVRGQIHFANATDPEIPLALAPVVKGIVSLHDFHSAPAHITVPALTLSNGVNLLMPQDWATIYDVLPLYSQGLDGSGQSIAVIGRTDVALTDVRTFRTNAGLPARDPLKIFPTGVNPGMPDCQDESESALDVEWAGAIAKNATIDFVTAPSGATDGVVLAAQYAVTNNVAPIVTMSYLHCENTISDGGQSLWGSLWSQAAAQGQSVFVASGDSGAAGCDASTELTATQGKAVNAICSTPNSTCVGGTEFNDEANPGAYWSGTNGAGMNSALSYIPELTWNESSWAGAIIASGGGISTVYPRPGWQSAPGVTAGTMRLVPDIAASSAVHDAYVIEIQGGAFYVAGTSAATPSLASVMALVLQNAGSRQGNANPALYTLASQQAIGGPTVFHDITGGNNSVPGVTGYSAGTGYDMTTGLGSVDAFLLVNSWNNSRSSNFALSSYSSSLTVVPGSSTSATLTMTAQGGFTSPVTLTAVGTPSGVAVSFSPTTLTASAPVTMTLTAAPTATGGMFPIAVIGTGGGFTRTLEFTATVSAASFTLSPNPLGASVNVGSSALFTITASSVNGFSSPVALSVSGVPAGVTASFSPTTITGGSGTSTLTVSVASGAAAGTSVLAVNGIGGGLTQTQTITLAVANPNLTLSASATGASVAPGSSVPITVTTTAGAGFNSTVYLSVTGQPTGVTAALSPTSIAAPGSGTSALTISVSSGATAGVYSLTIGAVGGGGSTKLLTFTLTVLPAASFALSTSATTASLAPGSSTRLTVTTVGGTGFNAAIALSVTGLPTGVTAGFAPTSIASPGTGSSTLTLTAASTAPAGAFTLTMTATGGGATKSQSLALTVFMPSFTLSSNVSTVSLAPGGTITATLAIAGVNGFSSAVAMSIAGLPSGITAVFAPASIASPGAGSSVLTLSAITGVTPGTFILTITASGGGLTKTQSLGLTVMTPSFTLASSVTSASLAPGGSALIGFPTTRVNGFSSSVTLSIAGLPSGVTAGFAPANIASPGAGGSTLTLTAAATAQASAETLTVSAVGGGVTRIQALSLTVMPAFTLSLSASNLTVARGGSGSITVTATGATGFNSALSLSAIGLPSGVTATFTPTSIAAPGTGHSTMTLSLGSALMPGVSAFTVSAAGGGITRNQAISLTVPAPGFTLAASAAGVSLVRGGSTRIVLTTVLANGFNAAMTFSISGLPSGVTASFAPAGIAAPGGGSTTLTLVATPSAPASSSTPTITATGGGMAKTQAIQLTVSITQTAAH